MILYANGCSHTAAAEAVIPACFADDDGRHGIDRRPHPTNLAASWCTHVAAGLGRGLVCQAESGGSNARILRTTRQWIANNPALVPQTFFVLQWTTWERQEWLHRGVYYQVNASGTDWVPEELQQRYKQYVIDVDWDLATKQAHEQIWQLHQELKDQKIRHLFFSGHSSFSDIEDQRDWSGHYIDPYQRGATYHNWLRQNGGVYANPHSYHFDAQSHRLWADHVLEYVHVSQLAQANEISSD
jgi:hypothetical protein